MLRRRTRIPLTPGLTPALRELVDPDVTGRGVTIAFLDAGFVGHPDLGRPASRLREYVDVTPEKRPLTAETAPGLGRGTLAAVVAAGSGFLSGGLHRGAASQASLVLVKVGRQGRISARSLEQGLDRVIRMRQAHGIRVVNLPGFEGTNRTEGLEQRLEELHRQGVVLVAPAPEDDAGWGPADDPRVIAVGTDQGRQADDDEGIGLYAQLQDAEVVKPEVICPPVSVAVPVLPGSVTDRRSDVMLQLARASDQALPRLLENLRQQDELPAWLAHLSPEEIRSVLVQVGEQARFLNPHYRTQEGSQFAAPILSSLAAQMLEVNPRLGPDAVRQILISTADRVRGAPALVQGFGMFHPARALALAGVKELPAWGPDQLAPRVQGHELVFSYRAGNCHQVGLAGDFNSWNPGWSPMARVRHDFWRCRVDVPPPGPVRYKFVVDGRWVQDPANLAREKDPFGGVNSVVWIR